MHTSVIEVTAPAWPVWQYRTTKGVCKVVWRTCDGVRVDVSVLDGNSHGWITASAYSSWQECCDDPKTYPCDESGKRIEEVKMPSMEELDELCTEPCKEWRDDRSFADEDYDKRVADLERQIAEYKCDAELCRELRTVLQRKAGTEYVINIEQVIGIGIYGDFRKTLASIRDGGAE